MDGSGLTTASDAWLAPVVAAPFVGSFLGVLITRLPQGRPVTFARSACDRCTHRLLPRDLVPLLSYVLARGRCRYCGEPIGGFVLAVELAALGIAVWAAVSADGAGIWVTCLLGWTLLAMAWIDLRTMLLPDLLTMPLLVAGLGDAAVFDPDALADRLVAAAAGYLLLLATASIYRLLRGRDGLGLGDAKLLAGLGAWLGLAYLPLVLLLAACLGLSGAVVGALRGQRMTASTAIPFGPCLALAGWILWLYGDPILSWLGQFDRV
jgi:leader peptidase (prepilin peptidase)/N-methyltransferase